MKTNYKLFFWMTLAMLGWGASWPLANVLSGYVNEHEFMTYRYALTTLTLIPVLWWMGLSFKISLRNFLMATLAAVFLIFYTKYYFLSTVEGTPGLAAAVVTTIMPIIVYLLMLFSKQKKPALRDWLALLLGAIGVLITMKIWHFQLDEILSVGNFYLIAAPFFWALVSITTSYAKPINSAVLSFYIYLMVTILDAMFFLNPVHGSIFNMDSGFWVSFLILVLGSTTFATTIYFVGIKELGSKQASVFTFLVPFFAVGLSAIFLNEPLQWTTIVGALITIIALMILSHIKFQNKT